MKLSGEKFSKLVKRISREETETRIKEYIHLAHLYLLLLFFKIFSQWIGIVFILYFYST